MIRSRPLHLFPIVERELRVAARRRGTYWSRSLAAVVAILILAVLSLEVSQVSPRGLGPILFSALAGLFGLVAAVSGVRHTADCLSEEKREGTLGLLFLTDLRGFDVVLGKLAATSINAFYALLAILPILAVTFLLGGVSLDYFGRVTLVLINTLFLSLNAGLCVSSFSRDARKAMSATLLIVLLVVAGLPALSAYLVTRVTIPEIASWLMLPSPGYSLMLASDLAYAARSDQFWASLATGHLIGWCLLITACVAAPHTWKEHPTDPRPWLRRQFWQRLLLGPESSAHHLRNQLLDRNPCLWLGARHRFRQYLIWLFLAFLALLWFLGWLKWRSEWLTIEVSIMTAFIFHLFLKLALASEAAQRLGPERHQRTLELVLATPLSVREILQGHLLALRGQFLGPVLVVLCFDLVLFMLGFRASAHWAHSSWTSLAFVGVSTFLLDLYALAWTGLWTGLTARYPNRAAGQAVARVLVLPWLLWIAMLIALQINRARGGGFLLFWFLISIANSILFLAWSRHQLHRNLRELASIQPPQRSSWFRSTADAPPDRATSAAD